MRQPEEWEKAWPRLPTTSDVLSAAHELTNAAFKSLRNFLTYTVKSNLTEPQLKASAGIREVPGR